MTPKRKAELHSIDSVLNYLKVTREQTLRYLEENPIDVLSEIRRLPDGYRGELIDDPTIGWICHRIFDHETYHLEQVNTLLRLQTINPPNM